MADSLVFAWVDDGTRIVAASGGWRLSLKINAWPAYPNTDPGNDLKNAPATLVNAARAAQLLPAMAATTGWVARIHGLALVAGKPVITPVESMASVDLQQAANRDAIYLALYNAFVDFRSRVTGKDAATIRAQLTATNAQVPSAVVGYAPDWYVSASAIAGRVDACLAELQKRAQASVPVTPTDTAPADTTTTTAPTTTPTPTTPATDAWLATVAVKADTWRSALSAARDLEARAGSMVTALQGVLVTYQADPAKYVQEIRTLETMVQAAAANVDYARQLQGALEANLHVTDTILATGDTTLAVPRDPALAPPPPLPDTIPARAPASNVVAFPGGQPIVPASVADTDAPVVKPAQGNGGGGGAGLLLLILASLLS